MHEWINFKGPKSLSAYFVIRGGGTGGGAGGGQSPPKAKISGPCPPNWMARVKPSYIIILMHVHSISSNSPTIISSSSLNQNSKSCNSHEGGPN